MTTTNPKALILAALAVPVVLLYLWRVRPRRRSVATGFLWEQVFAASERRAAWWSYRHPVSLCVQLAVLGLLVLALAEPHLRPPATLALVIDNSASMSATDVQPTRLDRAKDLARGRVAVLGRDDRAAIVTIADTIHVRCALTDRLDLLEPALAGIAPTREGTRVADAVELARQLLQGEPNGRIVVLSDACFDGATELARRDDVELIAVGGLGDNAGITRLEARPSAADPLQCQVLAEVTSYASEPVACRLELELDGRPIDAVPIELDSAGRWQRVFEMTAPEGGRLAARLDRPDVFLEDNRASAGVPPCPAYEVMLVTEGDVYLEEALRASPGVRLTTADALPQAGAEGAILVLDRHVPSPLPRGPMLVVDPADPCELWQLGEPLADAVVAKQNEGLAMVADARLEGTRLSSAKRLVLTEEAESKALPIAWNAEGAAVGYAIDRPGARVVVLLGLQEGSELPLRAALPILIASALEWVAAADTATASSPEAEPLAVATSCAAESDVRVPAGLVSEARGLAPGAPGTPVWLLLAAAALLVVVAEWHLFQRRWTC
ncbi:MAG TPA: BatA and WFA domain-containing protein [Thermoguttaceae bacterium]|nr:BatA and WFA domain-containing protein [Thermoguttaceae bacterium]